MNKLLVVDEKVSQLIKKADDDTCDWNLERQKLQGMINDGALIDRQWALSLIDDYCDHNKTASILDYGCGTGILNLLLLLKGYSNVHGVDVVEKFNNKILKNFNFEKASFKLVVGEERLPFDDASFDVISSSLVLEHVKDIDFYYSEAARVLKTGGVCFFNFPHRLKPYDSHSRCWFIHYFPKPLRKILWDMFARQSGAYLNDYLFLRSVSEHKRIARKYFGHVENISVTRMKKKNFVNYNGNSKVRHFAANLMDLRYVGDIFAKVFTLHASTDLYLKK